MWHRLYGPLNSSWIRKKILGESYDGVFFNLSSKMIANRKFKNLDRKFQNYKNHILCVFWGFWAFDVFFYHRFFQRIFCHKFFIFFISSKNRDSDKFRALWWIFRELGFWIGTLCPESRHPPTIASPLCSKTH